jgi:lipid A ethanolaminephosphotransferase
MTERAPSPSQGWRPATLVAGSSLWMATAGNAPLWRELQGLGLLDQPLGWALALALALVIAAVLAAVLSLLAWRWTPKPAIAILLLAAATGAYFMLSYRVVIDPTMITNVLQTDPGEASALVNVRLPLALLLLAGLPAWALLRLRVRHAPWPAQALRNAGAVAAALALVAVVVILAFQPLASAMRNHKQLRYLMNPLNSIYALADNALRPLRHGTQPRAPLAQDARLAATGGKPPMLVLVLGETGRSGNFALNGYGRDTTPELARTGVASWRNAWSCGTSTAASVPCMFSHLGRDGFEARSQEHENLLDVLQRAGLAVLWLDNQGGCKGVCDRVGSANTSHQADPQLCASGQCQDGILLEGLEQRIAQLPAAQRARGVVLVLHPMGSHGPAYWQRSPAEFKRFLPECTSNNLQDCSRQELLNAYDNSIAYTDHVLASTVGWLQRRAADYDTAMVYVADHGESLGENNLYLHGMPYAIAPDVQKHVPWITWLSAGFERRSGLTLECLRGLADRRVTHDNYFHSVLGLLQVQTRAYQRSLDAYAGCAAH